MSFNTLTRRNAYTGDGTTTVFPYTFKIFNSSYLRVIKRTLVSAVPTEVTLVLGTDYQVSGAGLAAGGNVTLTVAPLLNDTLVILGAQPFSQDMSIRNQDAYYPATIEDGADQSRMIDQQLQELVLRAVKVPATTPSTFNPHLPLLNALTDALKLVRINSTVTGMELVPASSILSSAGLPTGKLLAPTDGTYGGPSGNPAKVAIGDLYEDAFDKVATLLGKMVPPAPNNLSALTLGLTSSYQALAAGSGAAHTVTDVTQPVVTPGLASTYANGFADADAGTLSSIIDSASSGTVTLTTGDDTGLTNQSLTVVAEFDPYAGQSGKSGLYKAITAQAQPTAALSVGSHTVQLVHSTTGSTPVFTFYIDDPVLPAYSASSLTPSGTTAQKSGVPYYATGANLAVSFTANNVVRTHYNATLVSSATSPQSNTVNKNPASPPPANSAYSDTINLTVASGSYSENVVAIITVYNSKGTARTAPTTANVRVDTIGNETRVTSGTGQFPASGYAQVYDSTQSLASNKELQFLAGAFRYPPAVSYTSSLPAGPDYSALTPDTYNSMRWVTLNFGTVSSATSVTFTLQSASGFTSAIQSGVALYVRVDGSTPTSGWIDGNAAYSGVGSPSANGDAGLDVGNSSGTVKRITFGSTVRTGTVYVRIGIPSGSTKYFGGIA